MGLLIMKLALVCLLASQALTAPSSDMRAATCKCGVSGGSNRIVGGVEAKVNEFPWIASMSLNFGGAVSDHMCGGTLVSAEWIVTAAHCLYKDNDFKTLYLPSEQEWTLMEHDFFSTTETKIPTIKVKVEKVIVSPEWNSQTTMGDIALIKLTKPVDLKKYTPACLANTGDSFVGKSAWVYGWGQTSFKADMGASKLRKLEVKVASNKECMAWSAKNSMNWDLKSSQVCAGAGSGKDACKGDSGGPLTSVVNGRHVLIGDVSNGNACKGPYAVFGSIAYYRKWIDSTMASNGGANFCSGSASTTAAPATTTKAAATTTKASTTTKSSSTTSSQDYYDYNNYNDYNNYP